MEIFQTTTHFQKSISYHKYKATYKCTITWKFFFFIWDYMKLHRNLTQCTSTHNVLLGWTKHRSNVYSITQSDIPGNFIEKDVHYERTGRMGARKYLRKSCCHRIKCPATNFLAAFMWRRPLNSAALAALTYRGPERVFDRISTQVVA